MVCLMSGMAHFWTAVSDAEAITLEKELSYRSGVFVNDLTKTKSGKERLKAVEIKKP